MLWPLFVALCCQPADPVEAQPGPTDATSEDAAEEDASSKKIAIVWEAGAAPVSPSDYMNALMARLPPDRFEPVTAGSNEKAWVIRVQQPKAGVYRLEVAPPDRKPEARRLIFADPVEARRRLAILTSFVLEQGKFPEIVEGDGVVEDPVEAAAPDETPTPPPAEPTSDEPEPPEPPPLPRSRDLRLIFQLGAAGSFPTGSNEAPLRGVPGVGGAFDLGLRSLRLLWTGVLADYGFHPGGTVDGHRLQGGIFAGVRPQWDAWHLGARLSASGGTVIGVRPGASGTRPFFAGGLELQGAYTFPGESGLGLYVGARTDIVTPDLTFSTAPEGSDIDTGLGFGNVRIGVSLGLTYMSPKSLLGPKR